MNKLVLPLIGAWLATVVSHAQTAYSGSTANNASNLGVLGTSYADVHASLENIEHSSREAATIGILGNAPITPQLDSRLGYDYWWYNNGVGRSHYHLLTGEARYYASVGTVKPFIGGLLGYEWSKSDLGGGYVSSTTTGTTSGPYGGGGTTTTTNYGSSTTHENFGIWAVTAGVEAPLSGFVVTPHLSYGKRFSHGRHTAYRYGAELHRWFSETMGAYLDVTYNDIGFEPNSWAYLVGVRLRY